MGSDLVAARLTLRERSLINLAMLTALNKPREFQHHLIGALNNGCTKEEIREVLLQAGVYCGFPEIGRASCRERV